MKYLNFLYTDKHTHWLVDFWIQHIEQPENIVRKMNILFRRQSPEQQASCYRQI